MKMNGAFMACAMLLVGVMSPGAMGRQKTSMQHMDREEGVLLRTL